VKNKFNYCPECGKTGLLTVDNKKFLCGSCNFTLYKNVAAAGACIIESDGKILFVVRNKDPQKGFLDLPGGFIEPGETAEDGIRRECFEEIGLIPSEIQFFHSFPNLYEYKDILYNTCDLFFIGRLEKSEFNIDKNEINDAIFIEKNKINFNQIGFPSIKKALQLYLSNEQNRS
jgi:NAD+ diphosphatase